MELKYFFDCKLMNKKNHMKLYQDSHKISQPCLSEKTSPQDRQHMWKIKFRNSRVIARFRRDDARCANEKWAALLRESGSLSLSLHRPLRFTFNSLARSARLSIAWKGSRAGVSPRNKNRGVVRRRGRIGLLHHPRFRRIPRRNLRGRNELALCAGARKMLGIR